MFRFRPIAISFLAFTSVVAVSARPPAKAAECRDRTVLVNVGSRGNVPEGPAVSNASFSGVYRRQPVRISSITPDQRPRRLVLLVDNSGSMLGDGAADRKLALDVANDVLDHMPSESQIGLAFFSDKRLLGATPVTTDRQKLKDTIERLGVRPFGRTSLWDAIDESVALLGSPVPGDAIYVISDGGDNLSAADPRTIARILVADQIRLFAFLTMNGGHDRYGPGDLAQLAEDTGGFAVGSLTPSQMTRPPSGTETAPTPQRDFSKSILELRPDLDLQYQQILAFYRLTIELPEPIDKPLDWTLSWSDAEKAARKNFVLLYPHILMPCN
jgi:hypothetical protein